MARLIEIWGWGAENVQQPQGIRHQRNDFFCGFFLNLAPVRLLKAHEDVHACGQRWCGASCSTGRDMLKSVYDQTLSFFGLARTSHDGSCREG